MKIKETQVTTTIKETYYLVQEDTYFRVFFAPEGKTYVSIFFDRHDDFGNDFGVGTHEDATEILAFLRGDISALNRYRHNKVSYDKEINFDKVSVVRVIEENKVTIMK